MLHTDASTGASTSASSEKPLAGTVQAHRAYILIHSPIPPSDFPSRISTTLQRALQLKVTKWGGIVNFAWYPDEQGPLKSKAPSRVVTPGLGLEDRSRSPSYDPTAFRSEDMEVPSRVSVFTRYGTHMGSLDIPNLRAEYADEAEELIKSFVDGNKLPHDTGPNIKLDTSKKDEIHLLVCTHGARDCRCGTTGGQVFDALRDEVERRKAIDSDGIMQRVKVGAVSHVGGHAYAANLLVFPYGEWLGYVKPEHVPSVLDSILHLPIKPTSEHDTPLLPYHWRGRMGLSKEEQMHLYNTHNP
ncbi:hypothetical protein AX16_004809 [Volvariella volvacea WC 439]|nr:hypothetical protein AX16_004809 [Volvariella volvacea WC 439]